MPNRTDDRMWRRPRARAAVVAMIASAALLAWSGYTYQSCGSYGDNPEPGESIDGGGAAGPCGPKRKDNLQNIFHKIVLDTPIGNFEVFNVAVYTDWGYVPWMEGYCSSGGLIRWRNSTPVFRKRVPVGEAWLVGWNWYTSHCYDNVGYGNRQCLTRLDGQAGWSSTLQPWGIQINGYQDFCIGTRIGLGGHHHRAVYDRACASVAAASAEALGTGESLAELGVANAEARSLYRKWDRENATIDDFVSPETAEKVERGCGGMEDDPRAASCREVLQEAWRALSPRERHRAARLMAATARKHSR